VCHHSRQVKNIDWTILSFFKIKYSIFPICALAWIFSGRALALCGEALNILDLFGTFWGNAKKYREAK